MNNAQLAHIWANQSKPRLKGNNMFFEGTKIYSYGYHYLMGQVHAAAFKGTSFALIRKDTYSSSTSKHLSYTRRSVHGLMSHFCVNGEDAVSDPKKALASLDLAAQESINQGMRSNYKRVSDKRDAMEVFKDIRAYFEDANHLRDLIGSKREKWPTKKQLAQLQKHFDKCIAEYNAKNTPEMIAKRSKDRAKRLALKEAKLQTALAEDIAMFRAGCSLIIPHLSNELLQVLDPTPDPAQRIVRTSRGAEVPLKDALTLLKAINAGKVKEGDRVGEFSFRGVNEYTNDKLVFIGCHKILLSEAQAVLTPYIEAA